jgi:hypothetical protein
MTATKRQRRVQAREERANVGMPTTILVRPGGEVADVWVGGLDAETLRQLISDELGVA